MTKSRFIGPKATKVLCWLLIVNCMFPILQDIIMCGSIIKGYIKVRYVSETQELTEGLLNGKEYQNWVELPEKVKITGTVDVPCRVAVTAMGLNRMVFVLASRVMLLMVLISGTKQKLYSRKSVKLLLRCGLIPIITFWLLPLINSILIPNLLSLTSAVKVDATDVKGIFERMPGGNGFIFLLAANVLERARLNEKKGKKAEAS